MRSSTQGAAMPIYLLTDKHIRNAKPQEKAYRLADGNNLYLLVSPTGTRSWQLRYTLDGKPQTATLGKYPGVTLEAARKEAEEKRKLANAGVHVTTAKRVDRALKSAAKAQTFKAVATRWATAEARRKAWSDDYIEEVNQSLRNHLSALDDLPCRRSSPRSPLHPSRRRDCRTRDGGKSCAPAQCHHGLRGRDWGTRAKSPPPPSTQQEGPQAFPRGHRLTHDWRNLTCCSRCRSVQRNPARTYLVGIYRAACLGSGRSALGRVCFGWCYLYPWRRPRDTRRPGDRQLDDPTRPNEEEGQGARSTHRAVAATADRPAPAMA